MAIAKVRDLASGTSKSSASSIATAVMPASVPAGDAVLVSYVGSTTTSAVSSVTDTKGNTYTVLADVAGTTSRMAIAGSVLTTGLTTSDTITVNLAAASGIRAVGATEFSGLALTQDVTAKSAAGTSATPSTGASSATVTANTLTYAAFGVSNGTASGTFTQGTGYTLDQAATTGVSGTNRSLGTEHRINSSTGTQTADGTYGSSMAWDALEVVLQALTDSGTSTGAVVQSGAEVAAEGATSTGTAVQSGTEAIGEGAASTLALVQSATESAADAGTSALSLTQSGVESGGSVTPPAGPVIQGGMLLPMLPPASKRLQALIREQERKRRRLEELQRQEAEARHRQGAKRRADEISRILDRLTVLDAQVAQGQALREAQAAAAQLAEHTRQLAERKAQRRARLQAPLAEPIQPLALPDDLTPPRVAATPPLYVPAEWQDEEDLLTLLAHR
jgi:hypothetical protein